ncbi:MAG: aldehyde dehydrogenase family protein, partial [Candidatus Binatia bacterium]|nr:aldehyde dehydrogenase family protein [Candidatus Binatia bacterium]
MAIFESMESTGESRKYNVKSPVTMESIGEFTAGTDEEVHEAVARARAAQPAWAALSFDQRAEFLWKLV